jgi:hypothetical protein
MCFGVFIVEDIEGRQADIRNFFLIESNYRCGSLRRCIACRTNGCPGCTTRERQHPGNSQYRYGLLPPPSPRDLLRMRHRKFFQWLFSHNLGVGTTNRLRHRSVGRATETANRLTPVSAAMSAFGTNRTSRSRSAMSAFGGKADIEISGRHVCF